MLLQIDQTINPWIHQFDSKKDQTLLNNLLLMGWQMLKMMKFQTNEAVEVKEYLKTQESMVQVHMDQLKDKLHLHQTLIDLRLNNVEKSMNSIQESSSVTLQTQNERFCDVIERLTSKTSTSSIKGKIAEGYLEQTLNDMFPDYEVITTASAAHEADLQLVTPEGLKIMIESKFYSHTVPTKEIDKLKADMDRLNVNYAIFIAFGSSITGRHQFQFEHYHGKTILFLPNVSFEASLFALAVCMIKKLNDSQHSAHLDKGMVAQKAEDVAILLRDLDKLYEHLSKTKYELVKHKRIISDSLDHIHTSYIENESIIRSILMNIRTQVHQKLDELTSLQPLPHSTIDLEPLRQGNKIDQLVFHLLSSLTDTFVISEQPSGYQLFHHDQLVAEVIPKKTCVKVQVSSHDIQLGLTPSSIKDVDVASSVLKGLVV